ncbi:MULTISPECIES: pyridoxamine 5'-phosphate oxidase family protein [unclassified Streptomyces]|jgi:predicted pyridoxine 5'-phosphate oxidase superfamily flavin-nucleotide-binding protein|uniref:pyridoxamine 5'-phosphate oxidase family protein n=1 Tax=unclassified Streptomyces TaxID=2593676 RepID=UPI000F506A94|nr:MULTISPECIES: pyridoxamine 5'-phosphate oxidase family protein [unclassified Streptomyces]MDH6450223.1 putative pyridoxine 5'-phosphate oxidase superfamily flavin-nucleotide-binding protein [Streptomyces sp. SAI-119]MDH6499233.1 putative pyridoxine 5'-phosphate oxidase superfamily flavin-nucleotide-binding protein [Streptomyces sp. SAI-149]QUC62005.1 pyridoxamine 5'-phosphate oxidase family protein [Streptomyces sp. A2-16]
MGVYHAGSRAVQDQVGVRVQADHVGRSIGRGIREVAAAFLELQPLLVAGAADPATGRVWASPLTGAPGFARATGPHRVTVAGGWLPADPLATAFATPGTPVGTIALDPRTRRRMRLNGRLEPTARGFAIEADQVFSNCPKYLQKRESYEIVPDRRAGEARHGTELTSAQAGFVSAADTFFLASVHEGGADVSHRGGNPGFVRVDSPGELSWRDYPGNSMFLTLGNLAADPRAGLLLLDWTTGTALQLTGEAHTDFGPERRVRFTVRAAVETPSALPLRWSAPEYSPANPDPAD